MRRIGLWLVPLFLLLSGCHASPGAATRITGSDSATPVTVATATGPVIGIRSAQGQAYLGIPYAAPPVGALRWREPQPVVSWSVPRDARALGHQCVQNLSPRASMGKPSGWLVIGEEDCLNLNVYTPSRATAGEKRPVMVWIYGGALILGANRQYDPSLLAQRQDVVTVAVNYRLGAMGFLSHPDLRAQAGGAANLGLLDQQAALRWVRQNIGRFGGDPDNVTLFGESAGGWSVCAQLASPSAQGLFQRAIVQSGPCTLNESTVPVATADTDGVRYANSLGCTGTDAAACLRRLSPRKLDGAVAPSSGILGQHAWNLTAGDSVLPLSPREAFASGQYRHVPVLVGTNSDEGKLFQFLLGKFGRFDTPEKLSEQMASTFGKHAAAVSSEYPSARYPSPGDAYAAAVTDGIFACPTLALSRTLAGTGPTWTYEFADPDAPFAFSKSAHLGAFHSSEIVYLFQTRWAIADPSTFTAPQQALAERMQRDWARFAREGRPGDAGQGWQIYAPTPRPSATNDDYAARHRCTFWKSIDL